jgi:uncharacterized coiled-coil protein SlyX
MATEVSTEVLNQYKTRIKNHLDEGMYSFFRAGRELNEVKRLFPPVKPGPSDQPNEFKLWIDANFPIGYRQCCKIMRLATYHEELPENCLTVEGETMLLIFPKDEAQHIRDTAHTEGWNQKQTQAAISKEKKLLEKEHVQALKNQRTGYEAQIKALEEAAETPFNSEEYAKFQIEIAEKSKIITELNKTIAEKDKSITEKEKKAREAGKAEVLADAKANIAKAKAEAEEYRKAGLLASDLSKKLRDEITGLKSQISDPKTSKEDVKKLKADLVRTQTALDIAKSTQASPIEAIDLAITFHSTEIARHQAELVKLQAQKEALLKA